MKNTYTGASWRRDYRNLCEAGGGMHPFPYSREEGTAAAGAAAGKERGNANFKPGCGADCKKRRRASIIFKLRRR